MKFILRKINKSCQPILKGPESTSNSSDIAALAKCPGWTSFPFISTVTGGIYFVSGGRSSLI